jgi:hypothetical protein
MLDWMPSPGWKFLLTVALLGAICCSVFLQAPRQPIARTDLRRLVFAAVVLYAVGALASISHRGVLAGVVYASGILVCSLAVWLSRGADLDDGSDDDPGSEPPTDEKPSGGPDGLPLIDWDEFDHERARWNEHEPVS